MCDEIRRKVKFDWATIEPKTEPEDLKAARMSEAEAKEKLKGLFAELASLSPEET